MAATATDIGPTRHVLWNFHVNLALIAIAIVAVYAIRTWKQEKSCNCKLKALEEQREHEVAG
jgi:hypothetical protein